MVRNGIPKLGTDLAVPDIYLAEMMDAYEACPLPHVLFGHIGDNHLHLNMLQSQTEYQQAKDYYAELAQIAIRLGGTVRRTWHRKIKRAALENMVGTPLIHAFRALKKHLDPNLILGRGTLFE